MAKKTNKKLALKRETLRSLSDDQLQAVAGGTLYEGTSIYGQGGIRTSLTSPPPPPPSGDTFSVVKYNYSY